ncbi:MAG: ATP-dependent protease ATPase subunit HslU [Deltaproteobacteria bacterium]|nr:ATP-dependent protease ATPase subunit HslU [Deltaproteobacteria bacterium]
MTDRKKAQAGPRIVALSTEPEGVGRATSFTPREIVSELDRFIVGQGRAKRAVAVALRNRWRRHKVPEELRDEITPKNIIMIGPTGVGKTEIARRLSRLAQAPFVKVEASKFTEVGYVGRDVDSIIRDLVETSVRLVHVEETEKVKIRAAALAEDIVLDIIDPPPGEMKGPAGFQRPFGFDIGLGGAQPAATPDQGKAGDAMAEHEAYKARRKELRQRLRDGELDEELVELEVAARSNPMIEIFSSQGGMEEMEIKLQDMLQNLPGAMGGGGKKKTRKVRVSEALELMAEAEAQKLVDQDKVTREGKLRAEHDGIVFLDELDKIAGRQAVGHGPDVSREGVQRDLLPIIEGTTVQTKYGSVSTEHVLFIAAGAFHVAKPSDLIPELQGRFPIRVELDALTKEDFVRILTEPENALTLQYRELLKTEDVDLSYGDSAVDAIAESAARINEKTENIGARRLYTIMEAMLEEISFSAPERSGEKIVIDADYVTDKLEPFMKDSDLSDYIL